MNKILEREICAVWSMHETSAEHAHEVWMTVSDVLRMFSVGALTQLNFDMADDLLMLSHVALEHSENEFQAYKHKTMH